MRVSDCMQTNPITITPDDLVSTAYQRMHGSKIRHLPVIEGEATLVGIVTDRDIRQAAASDEPHLAEHELTYLLDKMTVRDIMTTRVVTVRADTPIAEAGGILLHRKFGCLPVVDDSNTLQGIITVTDLLEAYVRQHD